MGIKTYALTTRSRAEEFLGTGTLTGVNASVLDRVIDGVTSFIENYCNRRFQETAYSNELYDADHSDGLVLSNYPVSSTDTFTLQERTTSENSDSWSTIQSDEYFVNYDSGIVRLASGRKFQRGRSNYRVTYTAGFDFDNAATFLSDTIAGDLEYATWRLIAHAWFSRKGDPNISSERIGDYSVTYIKEAMENNEIKSVLDKYARIDGASYQTPSAY